MKKRNYWIASLLLITLVATAVFFFGPEKILKAAGGAFGLSTISNPPAQSGQITATSTLNYLTPGTGTTTVTVDTRGTDQLALNVFMVASSTSDAADLRWTIEFSHSTSSVLAEQIWFPLAENLNINATTTFRTSLAKEFGWKPASTTRHAIATSTTANSTFTSLTAATRIGLEDIVANWTRFIFYIPTTGTSLNESTALGSIPTSTSTNAGIQVFVVKKEPL